MNSIKHGFTLLELLTAIAMIVLITGAMTAAVAGAHRRAKIQKATADVKSVTQAILGYENYAPDECAETFARFNGERGVDCDANSLGFLLGKNGKSEYGSAAKIPVLLMAALSSGGKMLDPWGTPYRVRIRKGQVSVQSQTAAGAMSTGYVIPNFYRLTKEERQ